MIMLETFRRYVRYLLRIVGECEGCVAESEEARDKSVQFRDLEAARQRTLDARAHLLVVPASGTLPVLDSQGYMTDVE